MWVLYLNPMRDRSEAMDTVAWAETREALERFLQSETVEPYRDEGIGSYGYNAGMVQSFSKVFRKGGPLEWYNPPSDLHRAIINAGTYEEHLQRLRDEWEGFRSGITCVS